MYPHLALETSQLGLRGFVQRMHRKQILSDWLKCFTTADTELCPEQSRPIDRRPDLEKQEWNPSGEPGTYDRPMKKPMGAYIQPFIPMNHTNVTRTKRSTESLGSRLCLHG